MTWTRESLIAFERRVEQAFLDKAIRGPVHLSGGNEDQLIAIFKDVRPGDWVFSTWRSHYHALLKGIPEEWVWNEILAGRSMYLMNKEHRFLSSAIVGGTLPIAAGVAMGVKWENKKNSEASDKFWASVLKGTMPAFSAPTLKTVWVFVGDMCARTGLFHEFAQYVLGKSLPVRIVVEDNGMATNTPTVEAWGCPRLHRWLTLETSYQYERTYPHVGVGTHVVF